MTDKDPPFKHPIAGSAPQFCKVTLRELMPVCQRLAYYDHAAVAPLPAPCATAMSDFVVEASQLGDTAWPKWNTGVERLRVGLSELLNAKSEEIALVPNTTIGIGLVAEGWRWKAGDSVVVPANEFPSNLVPWRSLARRGVEIREVPVPASGELELESLLDAMDGSTRMVTLSWVGFASGWRTDVERFCRAIHERGGLVFLDAIQGLGSFPLDVAASGVDFVAADGHKWMLGPEGAGVLFVRAEHLERLEPLMIGWRSLNERHAFDPAGTELKNNTSRFEGGSLNTVGMLGLEASVQVLLQQGSHRPDSGFAEAILTNVAELEDWLRSAGCEVHLPKLPAHRSGILSVTWPDADLLSARKFCLSRGIVTSVRAGRLRVSTHAYNNSDDARRLAEALKDFMREQPLPGQHG